MKGSKIISTITKILLIVLISLIAFTGIYMQKANRMENIVKDYKYNIDLDARRVITLKVNDEKETILKDAEGKEVKEELTDEQIKERGYTKEEKAVNDASILTLENYKKSKEIIEERLKALGVNNYIIRLDENTGTVYLEVPEDDKVDKITEQISEIGKFEIQDAENEEVLLNNDQLKKVQVLYSTDTDGTKVHLSIELNKEGREKLKEITKTYIKTEQPVQEENTTTDNETKNDKSEESSEAPKTETVEKKVSLKIDGEELLSTSFDEPRENGIIQITMGSATTDTEELNNIVEEASKISTLLDNGKLPVKYKVDENKYVGTNLTKDIIQKIIITMSVIMIIALVILSIRYKSKGFLASISFIGFIAICTLIVRYTNVFITLNSLVAISIIAVLNYVFNLMILKLLKKEESLNKAIKDSYKDFFIKIIPVIIISVTFSFINWIPVSSFGMTMIWGLLVMAIYNVIVTRSFLK